MNCDKCNKCILKEVLLACKNFDFLKTHKRSCTLYATHYTSMATGHNSSVVAELSSPVPCKIAAKASPIRGYPELPDLSVSSLFWVLDNETKGRTRYYLTWLHVAKGERHKGVRTTCRIIKIGCGDNQRGVPSLDKGGRVDRTLSMYVEFKHSWGREAHISCCTMTAELAQHSSGWEPRNEERDERYGEGQMSPMCRGGERTSLKRKWSHIWRILSKEPLNRGT